MAGAGMFQDYAISAWFRVGARRPKRELFHGHGAPAANAEAPGGVPGLDSWNPGFRCRPYHRRKTPLTSRAAPNSNRPVEATCRGIMAAPPFGLDHYGLVRRGLPLADSSFRGVCATRGLQSQFALMALRARTCARVLAADLKR
jgi:hypothetical protein